MLSNIESLQMLVDSFPIPLPRLQSRLFGILNKRRPLSGKTNNLLGARKGTTDQSNRMLPTGAEIVQVLDCIVLVFLIFENVKQFAFLAAFAWRLPYFSSAVCRSIGSKHQKSGWKWSDARQILVGGDIKYFEAMEMAGISPIEGKLDGLVEGVEGGLCRDRQ